MTIELPAALLTPSAKILDTGGWFIPFNHATHVVDLMPYETRGGALQLHPLPGERFSKATWYQINFLDAGFQLPFPDKFFDFSVCGHTVEDLADPGGLIAELRRVSKAGYIETPSRLCEQTVGVRDRMTDEQGHPHHHWIVEAENNRLVLSGKSASLFGPRRVHAVPLRTYEALQAGTPDLSAMCFHWSGDFDWEVVSDSEATRRARVLVSSLGISATERALDLLVRKLRHLKRSVLHPAARAKSEWWREMLTISRPYSTIPL